MGVNFLYFTLSVQTGNRIAEHIQMQSSHERTDIKRKEEKILGFSRELATLRGLIRPSVVVKLEIARLPTLPRLVLAVFPALFIFLTKSCFAECGHNK